MLQKIRNLENTHILLWLIKDTCWVLEFKLLGLIMILPTIAMAFYLSYLSRVDKKELLHNLAVSCWILANSVWMIGEFYLNDSTRPIAAGFFILGLAFVAIYYIGRVRWVK
jgi:hypothetical protein